MAVSIPDESLADWLAVLKPYQREQLKAFGADTEPEQAAEKWVSTIGHINIAHFGGASNSKPFWDLLKKEFRDFLCNDSAYQKEKQQLEKQGDTSKIALVSSISSAVGSQIGVAATVIVPAVTVLLFLAGKMSLNAFCKMHAEAGVTPKV